VAPVLSTRMLEHQATSVAQSLRAQVVGRSKKKTSPTVPHARHRSSG
jgi:hypothetical protein